MELFFTTAKCNLANEKLLIKVEIESWYSAYLTNVHS